MDSDIYSILPTLRFNPVVIEIGAANGVDTKKLFDLINPDCYFAFEPDPRNIAQFKYSDVGRNRDIQLFQCAVGAENSISNFNTSTGWNPHFECEHTLSGSLKTPKNHISAFPHCNFRHIIDVRVVRLDDFIHLLNIQKIGFIWCDVQGAEDLVIQGGKNALSRTKYFFTEYYDEEMYEGQISAAEIHNRLPGDWEMVKKWEADILFRNTNIE